MNWHWTLDGVPLYGIDCVLNSTCNVAHITAPTAYPCSRICAHLWMDDSPSHPCSRRRTREAMTLRRNQLLALVSIQSFMILRDVIILSGTIGTHACFQLANTASPRARLCRDPDGVMIEWDDRQMTEAWSGGITVRSMETVVMPPRTLEQYGYSQGLANQDLWPFGQESIPTPIIDLRDPDKGKKTTANLWRTTGVGYEWAGWD